MIAHEEDGAVGRYAAETPLQVSPLIPREENRAGQPPQPAQSPDQTKRESYCEVQCHAGAKTRFRSPTSMRFIGRMFGIWGRSESE